MPIPNFTIIYNNFIKYFTQSKDQLIYFDFETTGLNPFYDKIIEYAFLKENPEILDSKDMERGVDYIYDFVNPNMELPKKIIRITGINDAMLVGSKRIEEKMQITFEKIKTHPFLIENPIQSKEIAFFRIKLLGLS